MQVGIQGEELKAALIACPAVLLYDARTNLRKKYAYFTKGIGLDPADLRQLLAKVTLTNKCCCTITARTIRL
jgi:hypothetical protein